LTLLEGDNLDGSSSITWRSAVAAAILFTACQFVSYWTFHRRIALTVFLGLASCILCWHWLINSRFGFEWEAHHFDGTFPLTWRSDLVLVGFVLGFLAASLLTVCAVKQHKRPRPIAAPANKNI
jgi:hypothetical protein